MTDEDNNVDAATGNSTDSAGAATDQAVAEPTAEESVVASTPEFTSLVENRGGKGAASSLDRFREVRVDVWAELGRVQIPIGELLHIGEGSVLRLDRPIGEPVDLVSQGVRLARGEIVVVDDCFAIRIKEIEAPAE